MRDRMEQILQLQHDSLQIEQQRLELELKKAGLPLPKKVSVPPSKKGDLTSYGCVEMYWHNRSLLVTPPPFAWCLPKYASAVKFLPTSLSKLFPSYSSNPSSPSSSMMHQLCSTQADTTHLILLSSDFTFNFISLGNLKPSNPKVLSITALFDAKCVLNFLCSNVMFCFLTLYGVISEFDNGYALSPMMWNVSSRCLPSM